MRTCASACIWPGNCARRWRATNSISSISPASSCAADVSSRRKHWCAGSISERGDVPPADFIPVAESLGLVRHIDQWVMRNVFAQMALWEKAGMPPIRVALNVSANWFGHSAFVEFLTHSVRKVDAPESGALILLEITEGSILRMGEDTDRTMHALHDLGVAVAIDDFGTGYSSLAYLKLPAVAYLKIDRSFVEGLPYSANDAAIVQAMLAPPRALACARSPKASKPKRSTIFCCAEVVWKRRDSCIHSRSAPRRSAACFRPTPNGSRPDCSWWNPPAVERGGSRRIVAGDPQDGLAGLSRSSRRRILPTLVFGSESRNSMILGSL